MKSLKLFSFVFVLLGVLTLFACTQVEASDAYVTVDINPSIELIVNPKEKVIYAHALNEDAEILLSNIELVGLPLEDALDLIIETAIYLGYIDVEDEEIDVQVSTIASLERVRERIQERVKAHINQAFEKRAMIGRAVDKEYVQDFLNEAASYGVTPGFLRLVKSVMFVTDEYAIEELLEMDQKDLIEILKAHKEEAKAMIQQLKDEFFAARQLLFDEYLPQIRALEEALLLEGADVEALTAELEALKEEFRDKLQELRESFVDQAQVIKQQMVQTHQQKRNMNQEKVDEFMGNTETRRSQVQERIDSYQKGRP